MFTRSRYVRSGAAAALAVCLAVVAVLLMRSPGRLSAQGTGVIRQWGLNNHGQSTPPAGNDYKQVACGWNHSVGLLVSGALAAWGDNGYGQCDVPAGGNYIAVAAGQNHCIALKSDGTLAGWGRNDYGQATPPTGNDFVAVAAGQYHSVALHANGALYAWGRNDHGQTVGPSGNNYTAIAAGANHCVALKYDGTLAAWGDNSAHQCDVGTSSGYKAVSAGQLHTVALKVDGTLAAWGANDFGQTGVPSGGGFKSIASGAAFNLGLKSDGTISAWGDNSYGQLNTPAGVRFSGVACGWYNSAGLKPACTAKVWGNNSGGQQSVPAGNDFIEMSAGYDWILALKVDGSLVAWGDNSSGQLSVPSGNGFIAIQAGYYFGLALKSDGSLVGWGDNGYGQTTVPSPNNGFTAIAAGEGHSLGLKSTGQIFGWGHNYDHQATPPSGTNYKSITAGWVHSLAVKVDGSIVAWGNNDFGQCNKPSGNCWKQVAGGNCHSLALKSDGTVTGFGQNSSGQLTPPSPNAAFIEVGAGDYYSLGLRSDGSLAAWGADISGQISHLPAGDIYSGISACDGFGLALCPYCTVTASVNGGHGTALPATQNLIAGGTATVTITPDASYRIDTITDNGVSKTPTSSYVITGVREDHNVVVTFAAVTHTVNASVSGGGGTVSPAQQSVADGGTASVAITPGATYKIASITDNGASAPIANPYVINNVTTDHNVVVTFVVDKKTVDASVSGGHGSVAPTHQEVTVGGTASITLTPDAHYHVATITDNGSSAPISDPYVINNVTADHTVVVTFAIDTYTVSASVSGGHGSVSPTSQNVNYGANASVTITPDAHYHVAGITDNGSSAPIANPYVINNVAADHTVVVTFAIDTYTISASVSGGHGSVSPASQNAGYGSNASIAITPDAHYHVASITDNGASAPIADPYVINNVTAAHTVVVTFTMDTYAVSAGVTGGHGSVSPTGQNVDYGGTASITLSPDENYHAATITDNGTPQPIHNPYLVTNVTAPHTVVVTFALDSHTVNASVSGGGGTVDPDQQSVPYGGTASININPDATHRLDTITDNGRSMPLNDPYVIDNVTDDHDVVVTFADNTRLVTASVSGGGGTVDPAQQRVVIGRDATITMNPDAHHHVSSIVDNGVPVSAPLPDPYVITDVQVDHAVTVTFAEDRFEVDASVSGGNGSVSPASQSVGYDGTATVQITPDDGYHVDSITDNGAPVPAPLPDPYVINNVTADHTVVVTFAIDTFTVDASCGAGGTVDPVSRVYDYGEDACVDITADGGPPEYRIASIKDNGEYQPITDPVSMRYEIPGIDADHTIEVTFGLDTFTVEASAPLGHGTVDPATQTIPYGGPASVDLTPDEGCHVLAIRDNGVFMPVQDPYDIDSVTSDHHIVVVFALNRYTVRATVEGEGGAVSPASQRVAWGHSASVDIDPEDGYRIASVTDNGESQPAVSPYVIDDVREPHDVAVTFARQQNAVNASVVGGNGTVSPETQDVDYGNQATITLDPDTGCHVGSITDNGVPVPAPLPNPYVIPSVTGPHDVVVTFAADTFNVTASASGSGGSVSPGVQVVDYGSDAHVTVTAFAGYHIASIKDNGASVRITDPNRTEVTIADVKAEHVIVAAFARNAPHVKELSPDHGEVGARVTVTGTDFGSARGSSKVTFNGLEAREYVSWADQKIVVEVPPGATSGAVQVVTASGGSNTDRTFTIVTPQWYLAEGSTDYGFDTYITMENPNTTQVTAEITYMTTTGSRSRPDLVLPPLSQTVFDPRSDIGAMDFSTKVSCREGKTIAVDRRMIWQADGAPSEEGHGSIGVSAPATTWYLPEGCSDYGFECWLLIQNPGTTTANCTVTYMIEGEGPRALPKTIAPESRSSFSMFDDIGAKNASILVQSDVPVIPERSMYRDNRREGHESIGTTAPAKSYYLAEGTTSWGFTTYVLVQNPNAQQATVTLTYMTDAGPVPQAPFTMPPQSRRTVCVNDSMPGRDFSTKVQADVPIIAERAMYWGAGTPLGEACHDSIGFASPHQTLYLPDGETQNGYETYTLVGNPNGSGVQVKISYLTPEGNHAVSFTANVPANSRATFNMADKVPSGRAAVMVESLTPGKNVTVERSMYWSSRGAGTDTIGCY